MKITFLGNFNVSFTSETHHVKSLESLGHTVVCLQEGQATAEMVLEQANESDLLIAVHTHGWHTPGRLTLAQVFDLLKAGGIPTATYHLDLWKGLRREQDLINDDFYTHIGHFFTVDKLMADWFNQNTNVKGHYLRAGVFDDECVMLEGDQNNAGFGADVIFVGSRGYHPEWSWRPQLIDWLHKIYGHSFQHYGGDGLGVVRGFELNQLYANSKVVVGDSLVLGFEYPYYWSDRVYETIGRGGFLLMPEITGLRDEFTEAELATFRFGDFDDLKKKVDFYLANDSYREAMKRNGFNRVKNNYTYRHRWQTVLTELGFLVKV